MKIRTLVVRWAEPAGRVGSTAGAVRREIARRGLEPQSGERSWAERADACAGARYIAVGKKIPIDSSFQVRDVISC